MYLENSKTNFIAPRPRAELSGEPGLDLHEIALSLGAEFRDVKKKFSRMLQEGRLTAVEFATANNTNGLATQSYVLDVENAKFFVAKYNNEVGDAYCRFLITKEVRYDNLVTTLMTSPRMIAEMLLAKADLEEKTQKLERIGVHQDRSLTTSQRRNASLTFENTRLKQENRHLSKQLLQVTSQTPALPAAEALVTHRTAIAVLSLHPQLKPIGETAVGVALSKLTKRMGLTCKKVDHERWGKVNAYPVEVVEVLLQDLELNGREYYKDS